MGMIKKIGYRVSKFGVIGAIKLIIGKSFTGRRRDIILRLDKGYVLIRVSLIVTFD